MINSSLKNIGDKFINPIKICILDYNFLILFSDWEATNEAIEEQVARESYFQWLRDNERRQATGKQPSYFY